MGYCFSNLYSAKKGITTLVSIWLKQLYLIIAGKNPIWAQIFAQSFPIFEFETSSIYSTLTQREKH